MTPRPSIPRLGTGEAAAFVVVTGLSGAGKSHAIRALEDLGYLSVDNLPIALIPAFADLTVEGGGQRRHAAVVVDVREGPALSKFPSVYRRLKRRLAGQVRLVFLEADDSSLLRRFSETRRPHPLAPRGSVADGIREERRLLQPLRGLADRIVDTTSLTVHELRRRVLESTGGARTVAPLVVNLVSFGYRHGVPADADLVLDVRFLPNPHFVASLRRWTGRHSRVSQYVLRTKPARQFMQLTVKMLKFLLPQYIEEGKTYLTIAIGCTGGRHRSVALADALAVRLRRTPGIKLRVSHRDISED